MVFEDPAGTVPGGLGDGEVLKLEIGDRDVFPVVDF